MTWRLQRGRFKNTLDRELLEVLIRDFGLDVNWRSANFYDTLLYQALKGDIDSARYLISKGACVNASLGGYPDDAKSHGYLSLLDVTSGFHTLNKVGGSAWLRQFGAISFENLPDDKKQEVIETVDFTREASDEKYIYRNLDQVKLIVLTAPQSVQQKLKDFVASCNEELPCSSQLEKSQCSSEDPAQPKIK